MHYHAYLPHEVTADGPPADAPGGPMERPTNGVGNAVLLVGFNGDLTNKNGD